MSTKFRNLLLKPEFLSSFLIVLFCIVFGKLNPVFFSPMNIFDLLMVSSVPAIFACGVMIVLISGGVDLSFMWIGMFAAYSTSRWLSILQMQEGVVVPMAVVFLMCAVIGACLGSFNGLLVSMLRIPIFIVTLGTANIFMGTMFYFIGHVYIFPAEMPVAMIEFSNTRFFRMVTPGGLMVGGLHISTIVAALMLIVVNFIMKHTMLGRGIYALGGDESSAERVGINLTRLRLALFTMAGAIAGIAGAVGVSNIQVANPFDFQGRELTVIAAVVIGGTRITGGKGSVLGITLGVLLTNILSQNLILIGVRPQYNLFVFGILILFAVVVQALQEKAGSGGGRL